MQRRKRSFEFLAVLRKHLFHAACAESARETAGIEREPLFTAPAPPKSVFFADYLVKGNTGVRAPVRMIGRHLRVGGIVQRVSSESVRISVATPDIESMVKFTARVLLHCLPGSVERNEVIQSSDAAHLELSSHTFRSVRSAFQHRSGNDGDDISSRSGSSSSRELHGFVPGSGGPVGPSACARTRSCEAFMLLRGASECTNHTGITQAGTTIMIPA